MPRQTGREGREPARGEKSDAPQPLAPDWPRGWPLLLFLGFSALAFTVFGPALEGTFISDDVPYVVDNPYTSPLSARNLRAAFDPTSPAKYYIANYAPLQLLAHAVERALFGLDVTGYHVVNIFSHALACTLLVALFLSSGAPATGALWGGILFAVHPANVEAVAWISQLKTSASLALALGALLAHRRRPGLSALFFALALLTKASAVLALPMAAAFTWARRGRPGASVRHWIWLGGWAGLFALYAIPQLAAFRHGGEVTQAAFADCAVQARTIAAIGARYLVMAASSYGVSAFQEPPPSSSWLDPWWLLALPAGLVLAWRTVATLRRRSEEAAYWIGAATGFAPVSQLFPFSIPLADRYLYTMLPGLIGGALLCSRDAREHLADSAAWRKLLALSPRAPATTTALLAAAALALLFALHGHQRARLWRDEPTLLLDAARHYPEGSSASYLAARRAALIGDAATTVAELRKATAEGAFDFLVLSKDPALAPVRNTPAFRVLLRELAGRRIRHAHERSHHTQWELRIVAHAHLVRGEVAEAEAMLERALAAGGPFEATVRAELGALRAR